AATVDPSQLGEPLAESSIPGLGLRIGLGKRAQNAETPHPLGLLRMRDQRPCDRRAASERNEVAPSHCHPSSGLTPKTNYSRDLPKVKWGSAMVLRCSNPTDRRAPSSAYSITASA